jgi:GT2 family glycosyltransferase
MDISFIILSWNSERFIDGCLRSIFACLQGTGLRYEVLVVDNGSSDNSPAILRSLATAFPGVVRPVFLDENKGTTVSRNLALRAASGRCLCVMDSDVQLTQGVFPHLIDKLEADSGIGMVVPQILYPGGYWQKSIDQFPTVARKIVRLFCLRKIEQQEGAVELEGTRERDVDYAISAFWLMKRELLESVGLLDEKIFYAPEDVDYCLRIWQAGYAIRYVPAVNVVHHTQEISRGFQLNRAKFSHIAGLVYLFCKHRYCFRRPVFNRGYS